MMTPDHTDTPIELYTHAYDYVLPDGHIATEPARPADAARLLVYDRAAKTVTHAIFRDLPAFLPAGVHLFLNDTRVIKARLYGHKASDGTQGGGRIELLYTQNLDAHRHRVMIRGRVRVGTRLLFDDGLEARVDALHDDGSRTVGFWHHGKPVRFEELVSILDRIGHIPLPPYLRRPDRAEDARDYQTLFAREPGAVAAPTASLHFTPELLQTLQERHPTHTLTLHTSAGTFKPVEAERILDHPMHSESFHIPEAAATILESDAPLLAVGTTVTRTIEYYARTRRRSGTCDLFLHPHNPPQRVNHLLTNFHLPKSTLIMLVSAFVGREKTLALYAEAIEQRSRFFSYGDAMLII